MDKIYIGQTSLKMRVTMGVTLTAATSQLIKYKTPAGITGSWTATVEDATAGIIYYNITTTSPFTVAGKWTAWGYATMSDNRIVIGDPNYFMVYAEGGA